MRISLSFFTSLPLTLTAPSPSHYSLQTELDVVEGMRFDRGFISPYFVTDNKSQCVEFEKPLILLVEKKVSSLASLVPLLESCVRSRYVYMYIHIYIYVCMCVSFSLFVSLHLPLTLTLSHSQHTQTQSPFVNYRRRCRIRGTGHARCEQASRRYQGLRSESTWLR